MNRMLLTLSLVIPGEIALAYPWPTIHAAVRLDENEPLAIRLESFASDYSGAPISRSWPCESDSILCIYVLIPASQSGALKKLLLAEDPKAIWIDSEPAVSSHSPDPRLHAAVAELGGMSKALPTLAAALQTDLDISFRTWRRGKTQLWRVVSVAIGAPDVILGALEKAATGHNPHPEKVSAAIATLQDQIADPSPPEEVIISPEIRRLSLSWMKPPAREECVYQKVLRVRVARTATDPYSPLPPYILKELPQNECYFLAPNETNIRRVQYRSVLFENRSMELFAAWLKERSPIAPEFREVSIVDYGAALSSRLDHLRKERSEYAELLSKRRNLAHMAEMYDTRWQAALNHMINSKLVRVDLEIER